MTTHTTDQLLFKRITQKPFYLLKQFSDFQHNLAPQALS